jgi:hypothetical protein
VNQSWAFAREWQPRWERVHRAQPPLNQPTELAAAGIDYVVLGPEGELPGLQPVYLNSGWRVFDVRSLRNH